MKLIKKHFDELTTKELYELLKARSEIFVVEQNCVYQDMDDIDYRAYHLFFENETGNVMAYLRLFEKPGEIGTVQVGRVITVARGVGLGGALMRHALEFAKEKMNAERAYCHAQTYAVGFYKKSGFYVVSGEFTEDGIPHVEMVCDL